MVGVEQAGSTSISGRIRARVWDVDVLESVDPMWPDRSRDERHELLTDPSRFPAAPTHEAVTENMVLDNYHIALAAGEAPQPTHLAFGDGTTSPQGDGDTLGSEVYRTVVGQDEGDGRDRLTSTFLSQNEANGLDIREIGFATGNRNDDWMLLTHAVLPSSLRIEPKSSNMTATFDYILEYRRIS